MVRKSEFKKVKSTGPTKSYLSHDLLRVVGLYCIYNIFTLFARWQILKILIFDVVLEIFMFEKKTVLQKVLHHHIMSKHSQKLKSGLFGVS